MARCFGQKAAASASCLSSNASPIVGMTTGTCSPKSVYSAGSSIWSQVSDIAALESNFLVRVELGSSDCHSTVSSTLWNGIICGMEGALSGFHSRVGLLLSFSRNAWLVAAVAVTKESIAWRTLSLCLTYSTSDNGEETPSGPSMIVLFFSQLDSKWNCNMLISSAGFVQGYSARSHSSDWQDHAEILAHNGVYVDWRRP